MTEERARKGIKNSKKLTKVVSWSLENKPLWNKVCLCSDDITMEEVCSLMDEYAHYGFMELYYLLLSRVGNIIDINIHDPKFIKFITDSLAKDIKLDIKKLKNVQSE